MNFHRYLDVRFTLLLGHNIRSSWCNFTDLVRLPWFKRLSSKHIRVFKAFVIQSSFYSLSQSSRIMYIKVFLK